LQNLDSSSSHNSFPADEVDNSFSNRTVRTSTPAVTPTVRRQRHSFHFDSHYPSENIPPYSSQYGADSDGFNPLHYGSSYDPYATNRKCMKMFKNMSDRMTKLEETMQSKSNVETSVSQNSSSSSVTAPQKRQCSKLSVSTILCDLLSFSNAEVGSHSS